LEIAVWIAGIPTKITGVFWPLQPENNNLLPSELFFSDEYRAPTAAPRGTAPTLSVSFFIVTTPLLPQPAS
jgi:hypothetical protein